MRQMQDIVPLTELEKRSYEHRSDAVRACEEEGFVNLQEHKARGSMKVKGMHRTLYDGPPTLV